MSRSIPPLASVRVFEAAARHGHFTRAADELGMTQAAVSYQIKLLEERLGVSLFVRVGRSVVLSEAGRRIAPLISQAFDGLDDAFALARAESEAVLTISTSQTFASNWLAPRLGAFQLAQTGLAVRLITDDRIVDLEGEADVAIRNSPEPWPGLASHFLMRVPYAPVASPAFLARQPPIERPTDIFDLPRLSPDDRWWERWFKVAAGSHPVGPGAGGVRLDSQILDGNAALAGQGLAILNLTMWQAQIDGGALIVPIDRIAFSNGRYWLVYPERRRTAPKVRAFRDWLQGEIVIAVRNDSYGAFASS